MFLFIASTSSFFAEEFSICTFNFNRLGINNLFSSSGSSSYHGQTETKRMSVGVDEVTSGDGVSVGQGGSVSVGHSGCSHNGGMVSYGGGIGHGSDLTDRINETILVIIFGKSLKIDIPKSSLGSNKRSNSSMHGSSSSARCQIGVQRSAVCDSQNGRKANQNFHDDVSQANDPH